MMFLLGLASIFLFFLPGYVATHFLNSRGFIRLFCSFGLSLLFNFYLVWLLTDLGHYDTTIIRTVLGVELVLAGIVWFKERQRSHTGNDFLPWFANLPSYEKNLWLMWGLLALVFGGLLLNTAKGAALGTVFGGWDPALSWNRWALDWYQGSLPHEPYHYPQLLTANYSLSYVFIGQPLEFFVHAVTFMFPLAIAAIFWQLALIQRSYLYLAASAIASFLIYINEGHHLSLGNVDVMVAAVGFASLACLFLAEDKKAFWLGLLMAVTAALIKQAGILFFITYLTVSYQYKQVSRKFILQMALAGLALILPWYARAEYLIYTEQNPSEVGYLLVDIHEGRNLWERFTHAVTLLFRKPNLEKALKLSPTAATVLFGVQFSAAVVLFAYSLRDKFLRWIGLTLTLPLFFLWTLVYSYDFRNLSPALPLAAWAFAYSLVNGPEALGKGLAFLLQIARNGKVALQSVFIVGMLGLGAFLAINWTEERLLKSQDLQKMELGQAPLNQRLTAYFQQQTDADAILSAYPYFRILPGIKERYRFIPAKLQPFNDWQKISTLKTLYPDANYLFVSQQEAQQMDQDIALQLQEGHLVEVWTDLGHQLFKFE